MSRKITEIQVRMYRQGTGDCFLLLFKSDHIVQFKMMIDCGSWSGSAEKMRPYIENLKEEVEGELDLLVITHEHKDHVNGFDLCKELFLEDFNIEKIWMAWTENEQSKKVCKWKKEYGQKKRALALAGQMLNQAVNSDEYRLQLIEEHLGIDMLAARRDFANRVEAFTALHLEANDSTYIGGLAGMKCVKERMASDNIEYPDPGTIIENVDKLDGIRIYVLGPPKLWEEVKKETGGAGESYDHNRHMNECNSFSEAVFSRFNDTPENISPFDEMYVAGPEERERYEKKSEWRRIDYDWLYSAGAMALRLNSLTNNLSLVLAIEFVDSGRVLLFPGDAEYGSWASWHTLQWDTRGRNNSKPLVEDLLNRTVFYKVAHHLSHNGTAKRYGLDMMTHPDLAAMATLDYSVISPVWKSTMPNHGILRDLLEKCKGRLMVMNEDGVYYDDRIGQKLTEKIEQSRRRMSGKEANDFALALDNDNPLYIDFEVKGVVK